MNDYNNGVVSQVNEIVWAHNIFFSFLLAALLAWQSVPVSAHSRAHSSPPLSAEQARQAYRQGYVLALRDVVAHTLSQFSGKLLKATLTHHQDEWVYRLIILQEGGYITKVWVDAQNGHIIAHKSKKKHSSRNKHENTSR